jgi:hypothetical protein
MPGVQQQVQAVARQAERLVRRRGAAWFLAVMLLSGIALSWLDLAVRFQDLGLRIFLSLLWACLAIWGVYYFLYRAWRYRCTDLAAAIGIEQRHPILKNRLSSSVAFASESAEAPSGVSDQLRRSVIHQIEADIEAVDLGDCLRDELPRPALICLSISLLLLLVLFVIDGSTCRVGVRRLLMPWGADEWPRRHVLEFVSPPTRLAKGQDFEVELIDANGQLPDQVELQFQFAKGASAQIETVRLQPLDERLFHRRSNISESFRYRATGGDDERMEWIPLQVVTPPQLLSSHVVLHAPDYVGSPPRAVEGGFRAVHGTTVSLHVRVDMPLSRAILKTDTLEDGHQIEMKLDADRCGFSLAADASSPWILTRSGTYGFQLFDETEIDSGIIGGWPIEVAQDQSPTVSLIRPTSNQIVTTLAQLELEALVKDDFAIQDVRLHFTRSDRPETDEQVITLWSASPGISPQENERSTTLADEGAGVQHTVEYTWDLANLSGVLPGGWVDYFVTARDFQPAVGQTASQRLTFATAEQMQTRLAQQHASILAEIAEVARHQEDTRAQVKEVAETLEGQADPDRTIIDELQSAELNQRQVRSRLTHPNEGIQSRIESLIRRRQENQLQDDEESNNLRELSRTIESIEKRSLPPIEHTLVDALKLGRASLPNAIPPSDFRSTDRRELVQLAKQASEGQTRVLQQLEQIVGQLSEWDSLHQFNRDLANLRREQESLQQQTKTMQMETLGADPEDLTTAQRRRLSDLTRMQNQLGRQYDTLRGQMTQAARDMNGDELSIAGRLKDALDSLRRSAIDAGMRRIASSLERNQLGQAVNDQQEVIDNLQQLRDLLSNQRRREDQPRQPAATQLLAVIERMIEHQRDLLRKTIQQEEQSQQLSVTTPTSQQADMQDLADGQNRLASEVEQLSNRMAETSAFSFVMKEIARQMTQASNRLRQADTGSETQAEQQDAIRGLESMQSSLRRSMTAEQSTPQPNRQEGGNGTPPSVDSTPALLAELELIRTLQLQLRENMQEILESGNTQSDGVAPPPQRHQQLREQQQRLTAMLQRILERQSQTPAGEDL